jgi:adenylyl cyclase-associated protein
MSQQELAPLAGLLDQLQARLAAVESQVGIATPAPASGGGAAAAASASAAAPAPAGGGLHPALKAYDEHAERSVVPFAEACDALGGLKETGTLVLTCWAGLRDIVDLGTRAKRPADVPGSLSPHLKPVQDSLAKIRSLRLSRDYDHHVKALMEMLQCCSWVMMSPPPAPSSFVKELVGSTDFWLNKVRKEHKGKDDGHVAFCDAAKKVLLDLSAYLKEYHLSGLTWNPRGVAISEAAAAAPAPAPAAAKAAPAPKSPARKGGLMGLMGELASKRTAEGSSAATGLKKVSRDQQTWRKEFKKDGADVVVVPKAPAPAKKPAFGSAQKKPRGAPVCEYQERGTKWVIENQTKETNPNGVVTVDVTDPKQQAYIYNCENATIILNGKIKSIVLDKCTRCALVFDTVISACEIVNCQKAQIQTKGTCPSFSIDKTDGCLVYLSAESVALTTFVTAKSSEMNVSWPDKDGDMKEAPIPEQFQHRLVNGSISSDVSDLYH